MQKFDVHPSATSCIFLPARWRCCRLINLVAEDNAIEDTIYHLHRALNAGRIDLERFLRVRVRLERSSPDTSQTTRSLAEEQFMKRALIEKITNGIPMGSMRGWS